MEEDKKSKGHITVGFGTFEQTEMGISDFIRANFKDNRLITMGEIEDGTYFISIENPTSTGRVPATTIRVSKETFIAMISASFIYWSSKKENLGDMLKDCVDSDHIHYTFSDNLSAFDEGLDIEKDDKL